MPGKIGREWEYFESGEEVAGLVVVQVLEVGPTQSSTRYMVRQTCCGDESEWTHASVRKRRTKGNTECAICTRRRLAREMGEGNKGGSWAARRAEKLAQRAATVRVESGTWAGEYTLLGPMGHRLGYGGADREIARGSE